MTYLVAITRWSQLSTLDEELPLLAPAMNLSPYDARLRLLGPLPIVLASGIDLARAQALVVGLRARGHGVIACDAALVPAVEQAFAVRHFELRGDAIALADPRGRSFALPYGEFMGLVLTAEITTETETLETVDRQLALGRAALTGGLVRRKTVKTLETHERAERQHALYLFRKSGPEPIVFKERELNYHGLGEHRASTLHRNFATLVNWLRRVAPHAPYDDRLIAAKRRPLLTHVEGGSGKRVETNSNGAANQLAAYLLMHGYVQGQV